ncbi:major Facilitator Superfamily protein [Pseudarthrobacter siccitolerans]|uniref:Major Facilitator Superfamily protein n=1 Tax=Pseudarthrobacter siccitolerans TaxID=861266 RepID=A0A024GX61_9MICC|nr:MFS transporter [Pseudarthrobacter siccitolerans]CCQ44353.1 major Facilitator Superfamily protein [Pseudarthrobacter siccitolerans]
MTALGTAGQAATTQPGPAPGLLLASQLIFNIGFYAVVPFLALVMTRDFAMTATAVGVVLGARVFSQQGLFLVGGMITDRWGPRRAMLVGCLVRISGYLTLALAGSFPLFLLGAVLTGMGGALFSPALESLVGRAEERRRSTSGKAPGLFALLAICGEIGAVAGPLVGALLLGLSFSWAALAGAAVFAVMTGVLWHGIPAGAVKPAPANLDSANPLAAAAPSDAAPGDGAQQGDTASQGNDGPQGAGTPHGDGVAAMLRDKRFVTFGALYSVNLLAYNQLYFGLPIELTRSGAGPEALAGLFAVASLMTVALQWPISRLTHRLGPGRALTVGFTLKGLAFATMAVLAQYPATGPLQLLPPLLLVAGLCLGHMCIGPVAMPLVLDFARGRRSGIYYGLLASMGGCAVLLGNFVLGPLYSGASQPGPDAVWPWAVMAALTAIPAVGLSRLLPPQR